MHVGMSWAIRSMQRTLQCSPTDFICNFIARQGHFRAIPQDCQKGTEVGAALEVLVTDSLERLRRTNRASRPSDRLLFSLFFLGANVFFGPKHLAVRAVAADFGACEGDLESELRLHLAPHGLQLFAE